jgi:hypothetical protein
MYWRRLSGRNCWDSEAFRIPHSEGIKEKKARLQLNKLYGCLAFV